MVTRMEATQAAIESYKAAGAFIGSILPLLLFRPANLRDAAARMLFSFLCGWVFYFVPLERFGWALLPERVLAASVLAAAPSWFAGGWAYRLAVSWVAKRAAK